MKASVILIAGILATALFGIGEARAGHHGGFHGGFVFRGGPHHPFFGARPFFRHRFFPHRRVIIVRPVIVRPPVIVVPQVALPQPALIVPHVIVVPPIQVSPRTTFTFKQFGSNIDP